jgi:hypothetical protein
MLNKAKQSFAAEPIHQPPQFYILPKISQALMK